MKIAFFHNLPGGGSVSVMKSWYRHLSKKNVVQVFSISSSDPQNWSKMQFAERQNVTIVSPWKGFLLHNLWILLRLEKYHKEMARTIDDGKYDLVVIFPDIFTKAPYILKHINSKKIYVLCEPPREFYEHHMYHVDSFKKRIANMLRIYLKWVDRANVGGANKIVAISSYISGQVRKIYRRSSTIIYPWVDTELFGKKISPQRKMQILSIGGFSVVKGHDFVIKSLDPLLTKYELIIIGDGSLKDINRIRMCVSPNSRIRLITRRVSPKMLKKVMSESMVLCIGSYFEPFGLTSIEAQYCGTPVVCVNEGGLPETFQNNCSGLGSPREQSKFLQNTISILDKFSTYSSCARRYALKRWDEKVVSKSLDKLIEKI